VPWGGRNKELGEKATRNTQRNKIDKHLTEKEGLNLYPKNKENQEPNKQDQVDGTGELIGRKSRNLTQDTPGKGGLPLNLSSMKKHSKSSLKKRMIAKRNVEV